jgi:16S rRNA (guanine966-N2)-methyltransferase
VGENGGVTRIVAGSAGGRRLAVPAGRDTRPTSDRIREALFSALGALLDLAGARVLDLYAGTGAVGLEALSRGAGQALLVEADARAARTIRDNARQLGLAGAEVVTERVQRLVAGPPPGPPFDLVFADPPYQLPDADLDAVLADLAGNGWLAPGAVVAVERRRTAAEPVWPAPLKSAKLRRYGDTTLWYGHAP